MRKILLALVLLPAFANAQYEGSSFTSTGRGGATTFATDYQCLGINPANLGWDYKFSGKKFAIGGPEFSFSLYSQALAKQDLRDMVKQSFSGNYKNLSYDDKINGAKDFTKTGFALNGSLGTFGFAFMNPKAGGFAFRINDNIQWYSKLGDQASDLLFLGRTSSYFDSLKVKQNGTIQTIANPNHSSPGSLSTSNINPDSVLSGFSSVPLPISQILKNSEITMAWTRDYNFSYGRRLFGDSTFAMFAGVGVKYVQGLALLDVRSDENGKMTAFSSLSPLFGINYGSASSASNIVASSGSSFKDAFKSVGQGVGFDFGLNIVVKNKFKLGASLINMGSVTWNGNVYSVKDTLVVNTTNAGLNNYNIASQLGNILGSNGIMKLEGQQQRVTKLPGVVRAGASYKFGKKLELGVDCIVPLNDAPGSYQKPIIGFGGDVVPVKWLKLQAGFVTGGNYNYQVPVGITIVTKGGSYECGIASRDAVTFFTKSGPTLSLSMGFMRFRF
jgi:hypothetical protein